MKKFRVLELSQDFMAYLAISSHNLTEPTNEFFKSITAYCILFFIYIVDFGAHWAVIFKYWPEIKFILLPFSISMGALQCGGVYLSIGLQMKKIKVLHMELQNLVNEEQENEIFDIYWNIEKKCRKYTKIVTSYIICNETSFVGPLLFSFYCIYLGNYDTSTWSLPFNFIVPFDTTNLWGWYLLWVLQFMVGLCYCAPLAVITSYFMSCCLYIGAICDHFDFLCDSNVEDIERNRTEKDQKKYRERHERIKERIGQIIKVHVKMFDIFKMVTDINSGSIFWLLPPNIVFLALSLYGMENTSFEIVELFFQLICVFVSLLLPYLHCSYADSTTDRMALIGQKIYHKEWFELPVELQKPITLIIARSQTEARFNGCGMIYCTLDTLGKLCKSSLSYYMVFRGLALR